MKILDRYLVKAFLAPFASCVGIFSILVILGRYFERMDIFNNFHARLIDVILFLLFSVPFWLNMVLPVATMLALLFSLGALQQRGELTAMRASGIPSYRLYLPFFLLGFILSAISMVGGLSFLPKLNFEASSIYRVKIKKGQALNYRKDHVVAAGQEHRRFTIGWLDADKNEMRDIVVDRFNDNLEWIETISAKMASYQNGQWLFVDGNWRRKAGDQSGGMVEEQFRERSFPIPEAPRDFLLEDKRADDMTGHELTRRIRRLRGLGAPSEKERVALQLRVALPFANVLVIALAIPFVARPGHHGRTQTFSYALGMAFLYWGMTSICQSLGEQGRVAPWIAGWMSNAAFSGVAAWRLRHTI